MRFSKAFRSVFALLLAAFLIVSAFGCSTPAADRKPAASESTKTAGPIRVVDDAGKTITLERPARRVVSLAPSNTEIMFALGAEDAVVGVSSLCNYPPEAATREKVGDFFNPNLEKILSLKPDLVLAVAGVQASVVTALTEAGIPVVTLDPTSLAEVQEDFKKIGLLVGKKEEGERLAQELKNVIERLQAEKLPARRVFFEISNQPLMSPGAKTFISDAIDAAGGINLGDSFGSGWVTVSPEELVRKDPEVYLFSSALGETTESLAKRPGYSSLTCFKNRAVYPVTDDLIMRPGPRLAKGIEELHALITGNR
jgi:iron complex transport system substrate-binding protein